MISEWRVESHQSSVDITEFVRKITRQARELLALIKEHVDTAWLDLGVDIKTGS
jgi:hypothetical protein